MKVMAIGAHPDDVELSCGGLVAKLVSLGHETGIADLTGGELGSSGSKKTRAAESMKAAKILRVAWRECCELPDTGLDHTNRGHMRTVVELLRRHRPALVLSPHGGDSRHPDHVEAREIVRRAVYLAGLRQFDAGGRPFSSGRLLYYMSDVQFEPTLIVDVGEFFDRKMKAIRAYRSQFSGNRSDSYPTRLNNPGFLDRIEMRARFLGAMIDKAYAEGFLHEGPLQVDDPVTLLAKP
ncbi:MAG: bacillithiol biosynthesis deacetylase BshB1 [Candidatus Eisenbacteria bacterium]|nr:bacillithiol biosynthesis deacetylase BshB1 [Candidatus Eisenbacteria bacterium]